MKQLIWKDFLFCLAVFFFIPSAFAFFLVSCGVDVETGPKAGKPEYETGKSVNRGGQKFEVIQIDGCEYIYHAIFSREGLLTHKGNCKNPIHIYNK